MEMEWTEADLESVLNEDLPAGYSVSNLRLRGDASFATLSAPLVSAKTTCVRLPSENGEVVRIQIRATKWVPIPQRIVARLLNHFVDQKKPGLEVSGTELRVDLRAALQAAMGDAVSAETLELKIEDGRLMMVATGIGLRFGDVASLAVVEAAYGEQGELAWPSR